MDSIKINYDITEKILDKDLVRVKYCGNITEIMYQDKSNKKATVTKVDKDHYVICSTGELKEYTHSTSRKDNLSEVRRSLQRLRDYINTNVTNPKNCRWITVTYKENMTDPKRLKTDLNRLVRKCRKIYGHFEYITACEPQGRGAWHAHAIFIFDGTAPFMANEDVFNYWGNGFVKVDKLEDCDNVGAYLTAYLGDIEFNIENSYVVDEIAQSNKKCEIKTVKGKKYIKGGRMYLYPPGFNLYRISKGIKKPVAETMRYKKGKEKSHWCYNDLSKVYGNIRW